MKAGANEIFQEIYTLEAIYNDKSLSVERDF